MSSLTSSPPFNCLNCANNPPIDPQFLTWQMQQANYTRAITSRPLRITHTHTHRQEWFLTNQGHRSHCKHICLHPPPQRWPRLITLTGYVQRRREQRDGQERTKGCVGIQRRKWEGTQHKSPGREIDKPGVSKSFLSHTFQFAHLLYLLKSYMFIMLNRNSKIWTILMLHLLQHRRSSLYSLGFCTDPYK